MALREPLALEVLMRLSALASSNADVRLLLDGYAQLLVDNGKHVHDLAKCYCLSGADPDMNEDWRLAPLAVAEVTRMRNELDGLEAKDGKGSR